MRVAVSGTHGCGKSTLIDEFLLAHPDFAHEPEPYVTLTEDYGESFGDEPSAQEFYRQLEFNVERLRCYRPADRVIFERCPVDFLAYLLALKDLRREESASGIAESSLGMVIEALPLLDLIVFLPLNETSGGLMSAWEDLELRDAVDERLVGIFRDDDFNLFTSNRPAIVEASGSTTQRLRIFEDALKSISGV